MTKVALYARFASRLQNENNDASNHQFRACRDYAAQQGWKVVATYDDQDRSGADLQRPGLRAVLEDAGRGQFDILLAESLDRLSRDQVDMANLFRQLGFVGVRIATLAEGEITELAVGLKATSQPIRGLLNVNYAEAEIIRRIFRESAAGASPRTIAKRLSDEGIPGPDGGM